MLSATLNGEAVLKGRSLFANRVGEEVASPLVTLVDDATNPLAFTAIAGRRRGAGHPPHAAHRRRRAAGLRAERPTAAGAAARPRPATPSGAASRARPACGCLALPLAPGTRSQAELIAGIDDGVLIQKVPGLHSGVNPVSGDFSTGAVRPADHRRRAGRARCGSSPIASTIQRMLQDVVEVGGDVEWLPMRAAGVSLVVHDVTMSGA